MTWLTTWGQTRTCSESGGGRWPCTLTSHPRRPGSKLRVYGAHREGHWREGVGKGGVEEGRGDRAVSIIDWGGPWKATEGAAAESQPLRNACFSLHVPTDAHLMHSLEAASVLQLLLEALQMPGSVQRVRVPKVIGSTKSWLRERTKLSKWLILEKSGQYIYKDSF